MVEINVGNGKPVAASRAIRVLLAAFVVLGTGAPSFGSATAEAAQAGDVAEPSAKRPDAPAAIVRPDPAVEPAAGDRKARGRTGFVLGLSWQPALCESRGRRPECGGDTADRPAARQFSLAGLRPVHNRFCKVPEALQAMARQRDWLRLPAVPLAPSLAARLAVAMPGTASGLERFQWLRNGSCQVLEPDAYFALQIRLLEAVNASAVGTLFRERIGGEVTEAEVKAAFDRDFAAGAGERVKMQCRKIGDRMLVTGLTIGLSTDLAEGSDLGTLVQGAAPTTFKCLRGVVDAAGRIGDGAPEAVGLR